MTLGCVLSLSSQAQAQSKTFTLDRAQLSGAPDDGFMVYRPYAGEETRVYVNSALGFALNPLRDDHLGPEVTTGHPMRGQFPVYLSGGIQIAGIVGFNLHIPFTPLQLPGKEPSEAGTSGVSDKYAAMNDVRLDARVVGWESNDRNTRIGAHGGFSIGTGSPDGFGGDRGATGQLNLSAEHDFGSFLLTGHVGPHFRPSHNSLGTAPHTLYVGSEMRYAVGAFLPMRDDRVRLGLEVWGSTGIQKLGGESTFDGLHTTVEWLAQGRFAVSNDKQSYVNLGGGTRLSNGYGSADLRLLLSFGRYWNFADSEPDSPPGQVQIVDRPELHDTDSDGDGYPDDIDACPDQKEDRLGPDTSDGCPAPADSDKDGIIDIHDKCPNEAEDIDGIDDKDGCPEEDADKDKVMDNVDKCPKEPGPPNADTEKNGCPTLTKISSDGSVDLLKPIEFARGKDTIKPVSYPILKEVATLMSARPTIKIAVHGHTDNVGSHGYNSKLSSDRAAAVRKYLINQGIDGSRLTSKGFGPDKPIADNNSADGRARNRRVEFVIQEDEEGDDEAWE